MSEKDRKIKDAFSVYWSANQQGLEVDKYGNLSACQSETTQKGDDRTKSECGANTGDQSESHPKCKGFAKGNTCAEGRGLADDEEKHLDDEEDEDKDTEKFVAPAIPIIAGLAATAGAGYLGSKLAQKNSVEGGGDGVFKTTGPAQTCEFAESLGWEKPNMVSQGEAPLEQGDADLSAREFIKSKGYEIVEHDEWADQEGAEVDKNMGIPGPVGSALKSIKSRFSAEVPGSEQVGLPPKSDEDIDDDLENLRIK